ncbi:hypothetical protein TIFTF001_024601 [Ficus carica]|uniref:Uncharacterized protein n=1 Tax=Ficus carica TaxID=3494 RepID=A0AA88AMB6_FICCA|nr:hypothetical protein TIFTF001_024601 [Ficus carica]
MAGLQYNFFPTDFLYPKVKKPNLAADATCSIVKVPAETRKSVDVENNLDERKIKVADHSRRQDKLLKANSSPKHKDDDHGKRYLKYLSPYPVTWVLWIPEEP